MLSLEMKKKCTYCLNALIKSTYNIRKYECQNCNCQFSFTIKNNLFIIEYNTKYTIRKSSIFKNFENKDNYIITFLKWKFVPKEYSIIRYNNQEVIISKKITPQNANHIMKRYITLQAFQ